MEGRGRSAFPFCCIEDGRRSLSLAIPLDRCVTHRLLYDAKADELRLEYDFGLSTATEKFPSRADFRFFIYSTDPRWGFRAAAARYYELFPETFTTRARRGGLWMTFHDLEKIPYAEDFHFAFHENGRNPVFNRKLGVATLHYVLPGQLDVLLPFDAPRGLSFDEVEQFVRTDPKYSRQREHLLQRIRIMRDSVMFDPEGKPRITTFYANWARGRLVYDCHVNSDPDLPVAYAHVSYLDAILDKTDRDLKAKGLRLDGVYLDNFGGGIPNYRREHWASADHPLTFRRAADKPCEIGGVTEHEYAEHVRRKYASRRGIVFANSWTKPFLFHTFGLRLFSAPSAALRENRLRAHEAHPRATAAGSGNRTSSGSRGWGTGNQTGNITRRRRERRAQRYGNAAGRNRGDAKRGGPQTDVPGQNKAVMVRKSIIYNALRRS